MLSQSPRPRRGFTLVEIIVSVLLIAALASVTIPTIRARMQDGYENAIAAEMSSLQSALIAYRQDVGKYPPLLNYLTALPASPVDFCNVSLSATAQSNWRGPYVTRNIPAGFSTYGITQNDQVAYRLGPTTGVSPVIGDANAAYLYVQIDGGDFTTMGNLDFRFDGTPPSSASLAGNVLGTFQYAPNGNIWTMKLIIPKKSGTC
jgi:general secretion pathway protein G